MNVFTKMISWRGRTERRYRAVSLLAIAAIALGLALGVSAASAANIVANGGFETEDFTGWAQFGDTSFDGVTCPGPGPDVPEGRCYAFFGAEGSTSGISQILSTVAGQTYEIEFSLQAIGDLPSFFSAAFDGVTLVSLADPNTGGPFQTFSFTAVAPGASTTLTFSFQDDPGFINLDAVSVTAAVPTPAALVLVGGGLIGLALGRRQRRT